MKTVFLWVFGFSVGWYWKILLSTVIVNSTAALKHICWFLKLGAVAIATWENGVQLLRQVQVEYRNHKICWLSYSRHSTYYRHTINTKHVVTPASPYLSLCSEWRVPAWLVSRNTGYFEKAFVYFSQKLSRECALLLYRIHCRQCQAQRYSFLPLFWQPFPTSIW